MSEAPIRIGIIGGSGLYKMPELTNIEERKIDTPFGSPSDDIIIGTLDGVRVAFVPRHGRGHVLMPTEVPYCANIYALKSLGVERVVSVSACGSLREDYRPGDIVIPDQLYDNTKDDRRRRTFFGDGLVAHVPGGDWAALDLREEGYDRHAIPSGLTVEGDVGVAAQVYAVPVVTMVLQDDPAPILLSYLDVVVQGYLREFGEAGAHDFFATTDGWETPVLDDRSAPRYPRAQVLTPGETAFVDAKLAEYRVRVV